MSEEEVSKPAMIIQLAISIFMIILSAILIYLGVISLMNNRKTLTNYLLISFGLGSLLVSIQTIFWAFKARLVIQTSKEIINVIVKCSKCGKTEKRNFKEGDYVNKVIGTCECGGELYIHSIFASTQGESR